MDGNKVYNADIDTFVDELTETEGGIYRLDGLRYNGYFLYEKTKSRRYLKDDRYYYFEIRNDGETVVIENRAGVGFVNQPVIPPEVPEQPPKTGDRLQLGLWLSLMSLSLGIIVLSVMMCKKRSKSV